MVLVCVDKPELDTDVAWKLRCLPDARVKHEFYKFFFIRKKKKFKLQVIISGAVENSTLKPCDCSSHNGSN